MRTDGRFIHKIFAPKTTLPDFLIYNCHRAIGDITPTSLKRTSHRPQQEENRSPKGCHHLTPQHQAEKAPVRPLKAQKGFSFQQTVQHAAHTQNSFLINV